jgi:microcin C transport system substrate-binding protein
MIKLIKLILLVLVLVSCNKNNENIIDRPLDNSVLEVKAFPSLGPVSVKRYNILPGAEPSISAEMGGAGFTGIGWKTNNNFPIEGDPNSKKGGVFVSAMGGYPSTFRAEGKGANGGSIGGVYETIISWDRHYNYTPCLASHWKISEDKKTFWFRINPDTRWSDGRRVTTDDIIATYNLLTDEGILAPYTNQMYAGYKLTAESMYILRVEVDQLGFKKFMNFGFISVYPVHYLNKIDGAGYLEKYQYNMLPGTGPYVLDHTKTIKGKVLVTRRRSDYWAENERRNIGRNNFNELRSIVVLDQALALEKFKKGDVDFTYVGESSHWIRDFNVSNPGAGFEGTLDRGLIQKRKVYNLSPHGHDGIVLNMRKPPFDDIRVRKAFAMLYNRDVIIEKLEYNEKEKLCSYWPGSIYQSPDITPVVFDPKTANQLLDNAGWTGRNEDGYRIHETNGIFEITMNIDQDREKYFTLYQEDLKKAGIKLNLKIADWSTQLKIMDERRFTAHQIGWYGSNVPSPRDLYHSSTADKMNTSNLGGVKEPEIDLLIEQYEMCYNPHQRVKLIQQIDKLLFETHHYAFGYAGRHTTRIAYWNKFGMPPGVFTYRAEDVPLSYWWYEPELVTELETAKNDLDIKMEIGPEVIDYWNVLER